MSYFQTIPAAEPLSVVVVGAGGMGRRWIQLASESDLVRLVGVVDIDVRAATEAASQAGPNVPCNGDLSSMLEHVQVDALINATIPEAHVGVSEIALRAHVPVLSEKPLVPSLVDAYRLAGLAESRATLLMASQSRRYYKRLSELRASTQEIGAPFLVTTQFFRDPHFGGFREQMAHPLLVDMAIHAFDTARFLMSAEPVSVQCEAFNPPWSWYDGDAAATATFQMADGARFVYTGSWCSGGCATSWNGDWRLSGPNGSATWDGVGAPMVELATGQIERRGPSLEPGPSASEEIEGALQEFVHSLRSGQTPSGDVHANIWTLAMVHAAVLSADNSGTRVQVGDLLEEAYQEASGRQGEAARALKRWTDARRPSAHLGGA